MSFSVSGVPRYFYTAVARDEDFTADVQPDVRPYGRVLPDGAAVTLSGPRHAMSQGVTLCGLDVEEIVFLGTAFAPDEPGACSLCLSHARDLEARYE